MPHSDKPRYFDKQKRHAEQMEEGYEERGITKAVAHGRGHGHSSHPWNGNEMDTYAADLAEFIEAIELHGITLANLPAVDGEVARSMGRSGSKMSPRQR